MNYLNLLQSSLISQYWLSCMNLLKLGNGFIGEFFPTSYAVLQGLSVTVGQLDPNFDKKFSIRVHNNSVRDVIVFDDTRLVRLNIKWNGKNNMPDYSEAGPPGIYMLEEALRVRREEKINKLKKEREEALKIAERASSTLNRLGAD